MGALIHGNTPTPLRQRGALLIEVLVTIAVVAIGLTALLKMQERLQQSEMESYQRTQAMILVNDMADRIAINRPFADRYETASPLGAGVTCSAISGSNALRVQDHQQWCEALQGAAESQSGTSVGSLVAGRGCIAATDVTNKEFMITVVWQGLGPVSAPPADVDCAVNAYDVADTSCVDDLCRRYVTTIIRLADL